jgi:hypothetical protein
LFLRRQIVFDKGLDDLVDSLVADKAACLGARCRQSRRPARYDRLDLRIGQPAEPRIGRLAAGAAPAMSPTDTEKPGSCSDRLVPNASPGMPSACTSPSTMRRGEANAMTVSGDTGQTAS